MGARVGRIMVQVIPKTTIKKESAIKKALPWLSFLLVIIVIALYFIFSAQIVRETIAIKQIKQELAEAQTQQYMELEKDILIFKTRADDVTKLLGNRKNPSIFFSFLEGLVHPDIYFTFLSLDMDESEAVIEGVSDSFVSIGQQIRAFEQDSFIEETKLTNISLGEEEGIQFSIQIFLLSDKTLERNSR